MQPTASTYCYWYRLKISYSSFTNNSIIVGTRYTLTRKNFTEKSGWSTSRRITNRTFITQAIITTISDQRLLLPRSLARNSPRIIGVCSSTRFQQFVLACSLANNKISKSYIIGTIPKIHPSTSSISFNPSSFSCQFFSLLPTTPLFLHVTQSRTS